MTKPKPVKVNPAPDDWTEQDWQDLYAVIQKINARHRLATVVTDDGRSLGIAAQLNNRKP